MVSISKCTIFLLLFVWRIRPVARARERACKILPKLRCKNGKRGIMTKENKFKIGLCLQGIALSMDEITLKANEDRLKLIEDIIIAEPTEEKEDGQSIL